MLWAAVRLTLQTERNKYKNCDKTSSRISKKRILIESRRKIWLWKEFDTAWCELEWVSGSVKPGISFSESATRVIDELTRLEIKV